MSSRTWVYSKLNTGAVALLLNGGAHASTSLDDAPAEKPFIMYRGSAHLPDLRGDDALVTGTDTWMIFVHDVPGDYLQIDDVISALRAVFDNVVDQANGIIRSTWLETSEDFRDEDMGTIMKYCRIQVKYRSNP